jgi:uncharacterized protein YjbJ (UPF0337 family)
MSGKKREVAETVFDRHKRREAEIAEALRQHDARHAAAVKNMHRLRELRLQRDASNPPSTQQQGLLPYARRKPLKSTPPHDRTRQRFQTLPDGRYTWSKQMDREHIKGAADKAKGAIKDTAGKLTGDKKLQSEGKLDKAKGAVHNAAGTVKDAARALTK